MADTISLNIIKQLLQMRGFTANVFGHRVKVFTDEAGWVAVETFILNSIFGPAVMTDAIIDEYADLMATYIVQPTEAREDAIEAFEASHPDVVDAYYQREVAKAGATHKHGV
jgi:hypothetical protein